MSYLANTICSCHAGGTIGCRERNTKGLLHLIKRTIPMVFPSAVSLIRAYNFVFLYVFAREFYKFKLKPNAPNPN